MVGDVETIEGPMTQPVIELRDVGKSYAGIRALDGVSVRIHPGTVHALVGENGAGKSTLGRIVGGAVQPDDGVVLVDGSPVVYRSPRQALADGIAVIQQEPSLIPDLSVLENVFMGTSTGRFGLLDRGSARQRYASLAEEVPFLIDPEAEVRSLSIADQQKVEILRALARNARLIVMDEPTSSLGREESDLLHEVVRRLCVDRQTAVVYVSHFLEEILELADHFTILRNGRLVETIESDDASLDRLVTGMLGQAVSLGFPAKAPPQPGAAVLSLRGVGRAGVVEDISFDIGHGEILGLAGLVGSGRTEVARMIFGADTPDTGEIRVDGEPLPAGSPRQAVAAGVGLVPEDRASQGLILELSQRINVTLAHPEKCSRAGMPVDRLEKAEVHQLLTQLRVDPVALDRPVRALSGGNQQKVLFARWLVVNPKVLVLDEPTRGVDVGAKWAIYELIASLAAQGIAILLISSEAEEVVGLAHRVLVMRRGRVVASFDGEDVQFDPIMQAALGV